MVSIQQKVTENHTFLIVRTFANDKGTTMSSLALRFPQFDAIAFRVGNPAEVTDAAGNSVVETLTLTIAAQSVTITTPSPLPSGMATVQYPQQVLSASGGNPPYTFSVPANSLPAGLTLDASTGAITGTPTKAVSGPAANVAFTVKDSQTPPASATATGPITINP